MIKQGCLGRQRQWPASAAGREQEQGTDKGNKDTHGWNPETGRQC